MTASGWSGRFIEFKRLRDFPELVRVAELERAGIVVVSVDRDAPVPGPDDMVDTKGWLRPRLWGSRPTLPVTAAEKNLWHALAQEKRRDKNKQEE